MLKQGAHESLEAEADGPIGGRTARGGDPLPEGVCHDGFVSAGWSRQPASKVLTVHTPGRLDAEFVDEAALKGEVRLDPFLHRMLPEERERLGWPFQLLLAEQGLSHHG